MTYTFVNLTHKKFGFNYWACLFETQEQVMDYMSLFSKDVAKEYKDLKHNIKKGYHLHSSLQVVLGATMLKYGYDILGSKDEGMILSRKLKALNSKLFDNEVSYIKSSIADSMLSAILKGKKVIINKVGGYCFLTKDYVIHKTIKKKEYVFPEYTEQDISIRQWDGGTHYYAKIGNFDVKVDGTMKWKTESEAQHNAKDYLYDLKNGRISPYGERIDRRWQD